jgi:hypothetical protein
VDLHRYIRSGLTWKKRNVAEGLWMYREGNEEMETKLRWGLHGWNEEREQERERKQREKKRGEGKKK